ncbi:MAG: hypothetical protein ABI910_01455 [Gemmatimonadota bacterium]
MTDNRLPSGLLLAGATLLALGAACGSSTSSGESAQSLALGSWGGDSIGVIVGDTLVHVHIGCTKGDFRRPPALAADGSFDIAGTYILRAYPIEIGPALPARFTGSVRGGRLRITVAVDDTVTGERVTRGPATASLGAEAKLGPCPICDARMLERR